MDGWWSLTHITLTNYEMQCVYIQTPIPDEPHISEDRRAVMFKCVLLLGRYR